MGAERPLAPRCAACHTPLCRVRERLFHLDPDAKTRPTFTDFRVAWRCPGARQASGCAEEK